VINFQHFKAKHTCHSGLFRSSWTTAVFSVLLVLMSSSPAVIKIAENDY